MPKLVKQTSGIKLEALCDAIRRKVGCARSENIGDNHFNKIELHAILARITILEQASEAVYERELIARETAAEIKSILTKETETT